MIPNIRPTRWVLFGVNFLIADVVFVTLLALSVNRETTYEVLPIVWVHMIIVQIDLTGISILLAVFGSEPFLLGDVVWAFASVVVLSPIPLLYISFNSHKNVKYRIITIGMLIFYLILFYVYLFDMKGII